MDVFLTILEVLRAFGIISVGCLAGICIIKFINFFDRWEQRKIARQLDMFEV